MRGEFHGCAFIPLLDEPEASESLELLTSRLAGGAEACCVKPPLGGLAFIATEGEVSDMLDSWWAYAVPADRLPVLVMLHEPGLERWVGEMDAEAVIGVARPDELALYAGMANVQAVVGQDVRMLPELVTRSNDDCFDEAPAGSAAYRRCRTFHRTPLPWVLSDAAPCPLHVPPGRQLPMAGGARP